MPDSRSACPRCDRTTVCVLDRGHRGPCERPGGVRVVTTSDVEQGRSERWGWFSDDEILELLVNLRSADEAVDFRLSEHLLGELLAEAKRRALEAPDA